LGLFRAGGSGVPGVEVLGRREGFCSTWGGCRWSGGQGAPGEHAWTAGGLGAGVSVGLGVAWACSGQAGLESLGSRCVEAARGFVPPGEAVAGAGGREPLESMHAWVAGLGAGVSVGLVAAWACSGQAGLKSLGSRCLGGARGFVPLGELVAGAAGRQARESMHAWLEAWVLVLV